MEKIYFMSENTKLIHTPNHIVKFCKLNFGYHNYNIMIILTILYLANMFNKFS
jgi:uncharacterized pyridoxamine 5'-phosphate oxidase family protein